MSDQVLSLVAALERVAASPAALSGLLVVAAIIVLALVMVRGSLRP
jgi:hypothetical protein